MKLKVWGIPLLILLLCPSLVVTAQAKPIAKEVHKEIIDEPFDGYYAKGIEYAWFAVMSQVDGDLFKVSMKNLLKLTLHEYEGGKVGEAVATVKVTMSYHGTAKIDGAPELWTGTMVIDWVIVTKVDLELPEEVTLKGHYVRIYKDGDMVKEIGSGTPWFPI